MAKHWIVIATITTVEMSEADFKDGLRVDHALGEVETLDIQEEELRDAD